MKIHYTYILAFLLLTSCEEKESTSPIKKNVQEVVFASGTMEMEDEYMVSALTDGLITSLKIKEGDLIKQNQVIAILDNEVQSNQAKDAQIILNDSRLNASPQSSQLQNLQTQIDQAREQLAFDKNNYLVYKELWDKKSVSKLDFEKMKLQYEASQNNLSGLEENYNDLQKSLNLAVQRNQVQLNTQKALLNDYILKATSIGQVMNVYKKSGELVRKGEAIAKIGQGDFIIKLFVSEEDITKIQLTQTVIVSINTYLDRTFEGKVSKIHPSFNEAEQSYVIEAKFDELPEKLFSGTQLQANIQTGKKNDVLLIPTAYLKNNKVHLENGDVVDVEVGFSDSKWTEIKSGISENDIIIKQ
ncbi:Multidrug efflux pump subunit AcrA (membrane-fusion protein) [Cyclobacterium xiamenense]|uniref:Multidrug efflux pump subunit AcrA (Membrane-fusion protein) n=1 Tax=Cyclobacterium xiamenense TaxID=1297121 RepID=A0A1H7AQ93_9BACT|nr:HlyD family efflux transporter periplasmic adaptor subunit [Cyclobacterium xiamenense]SEJ66027.1 Multidrug efflux pump subunit AcrA (membrane-fusion protein) [Cyclobacterium xiamenense]